MGGSKKFYGHKIFDGQKVGPYISVTPVFFGFFWKKIWEISKMDKNKCPKMENRKNFYPKKRKKTKKPLSMKINIIKNQYK